MRAVERALAVRASLGVSGVPTYAQLRRAARAAGARVWERPLGGPVYGLYARGVIVVGDHLLPGTKRLVVAHELAHHDLGHGAGAFTATDGRAPRSAWEAEAAVYSFALLLGRPADTLDGLTDQIQRGADAGLESAAPALFAAASVLAVR